MSGNITARIDQALLGAIPGLQSGLGAYAEALAAYNAAGRTPAAQDALCEAILSLAARRYRDGAPSRQQVELYAFNDGAFDILFDCGYERTVMVHGLSRTTPPNSRDNSYHRGYPPRAGYEKGHAGAHAQGGREGGPNYFPQAAALNRRLSARGHLWRDIETYLAANAGLFWFVRLIYPRSATDVPSHCEYGLMAQGHQFRATIFPN
jgi:hypothetical protein